MFILWVILQRTRNHWPDSNAATVLRFVTVMQLGVSWQLLVCIHGMTAFQRSSMPFSPCAFGLACRAPGNIGQRALRVLRALGEGLAKRVTGLVLWLLQPFLVLFLR